MNDIIDNELTKSKMDLPTVLKWLLIGILGCIVFQSVEYFSQTLITHFLESKGIVGGLTSYLLASIISLIIILVIFNNIIKSFKEKFNSDNVDFRKMIRQFILLYVIIFVLQTGYSFFSEVLDTSHHSGGPDFLENVLGSYLDVFFKLYHPVETFIRYGFVTWILLKTE